MQGLISGTRGTVSRADNTLVSRIMSSVITVVVVLGVTTSLKAEEILPKGADVCDRYVEVSGGSDAFAKLENRVVKATLELQAQGLVLDLTLHAARPNLVSSLIESPAIGQIRKGVTRDGIVWENSLMSGPVVKEGIEKSNTMRDSQFDRLIVWRTAYISAECTGIETVNEKECYAVLMTVAEGEPSTFYYEKDSGLLVKVSTITESQMGKVPFDSYLSDYREVDGVLLSFRVEIDMMGQKRILSTQSIEHNVEMPEGIFSTPDEIKALLAN